MLNLKKLALSLCLSLFTISGVAIASEVENKSTNAVDILTILSPQVETRNALLGCTTSPSACSYLAGQYGYPYYYAEVDYTICYSNYPYACYGINQ